MCEEQYKYHKNNKTKKSRSHEDTPCVVKKQYDIGLGGDEDPLIRGKESYYNEIETDDPEEGIKY